MQMPVHPFDVLVECFFEPMGVHPGRVAPDLRVTADLDAFLARWLGTGEGFWLGLQQEYDRWGREEGLSGEEAALLSVVQGERLRRAS